MWKISQNWLWHIQLYELKVQIILQIKCSGNMNIHNRRECVRTKWKLKQAYN